MENRRFCHSVLAIGASAVAVALSVAPPASAGTPAESDALFTVEDLGSGYLLADGHGAEGKCGEGKCGAAEDGKTEAEGKCGEGKCGAAEGTKESAEGKCGEGKCGGAA